MLIRKTRTKGRSKVEHYLLKIIFPKKVKLNNKEIIITNDEINKNKNDFFFFIHIQ